MTRAVFTGVARDCARHLPRVLENLDRRARIYERSRFVFVVSDCIDDTAKILGAWLRDGDRDGTLIDLGTLVPALPRRTERIAHARNAGLEAIAGGAAFGDHLVVVDLDDVLVRPVSGEGFRTAVAWLDGAPSRAAVFANAMPRYYDVWALRHDRWCPGDCWHPIWGRHAGESFEAAKFREVFARQIVLPPDLPPVAVRSAFGGLGIYRLPIALQARYGGIDAQGREVSEHVAFNAAIHAAGGTLHIVPALQVHAPEQHLYRDEEFTWPWRLRMQAQRLLEHGRPPWRRLIAAA
jgi:hypothetical protein